VSLGYDRGELPRFVTPPDQGEQLVILHGSCRELFAVPPVEDQAALDDDPFEPPGGWPTAAVTPDDPAPVPDSETTRFHRTPARPFRSATACCGWTRSSSSAPRCRNSASRDVPTSCS
jgi:hypothetical protein